MLLATKAHFWGLILIQLYQVLKIALLLHCQVLASWVHHLIRGLVLGKMTYSLILLLAWFYCFSMRMYIVYKLDLMLCRLHNYLWASHFEQLFDRPSNPPNNAFGQPVQFSSALQNSGAFGVANFPSASAVVVGGVFMSYCRS